MARIGFSQRKTVLYLYAWSVILAGAAVSLRYVPYYHDGGYDPAWLVVMAVLGSRSSRSASTGLRARDPQVPPLAGGGAPPVRPGHAGVGDRPEVEREIDTGEWERVGG